MAQTQSIDALQSLLYPPLNGNEQDPNAASFAKHFQNAQADATMLPPSSTTTGTLSNISTASYPNNLPQSAPKGSNNSLSDNVDDSPMDTDINTKIESGSANASVLPQPRTLYQGSASNKASNAASPTSNNRPGLRLKTLSQATNAVTSAVHAFAHGTPQSAGSPPSKKSSYGIASGLSSASSTGLGISIPDYSRKNPNLSSSPSATQHQQHGIFQGLALAGVFGALPSAAGATGGGVYQPDATNINNTPSDPGLHSSFSDLHPSMSTHRAEEDDDGAHSEVFPLSASHSPYLQPHSRPLSPNPDGGLASPAAYPPISPYPSPGPSPGGLDGGLSPAAYSPGPYSPGADGSGSGMEGETNAAQSPTSPGRGRLRGRTSKHSKHPHPQKPYSATSGSAGHLQQAQFVGASPSRRSGAVEDRHVRSRGHSVGEGHAAAGGSRGTSPYPATTLGEHGRRQSASAHNFGSVQGPTMLMQPHSHPHSRGSPAGMGIPPLELQPHSAAPSRDPSLTRDINLYTASSPYPSTEQPVFIPQSYNGQFLGAPHSPNSPNFAGYPPAGLPGSGSPTHGQGPALYNNGTPHSHHSPNLHSPLSLSPHSGQVPSLTPSPEIFGPNVGGHPGSVHSSPGLGLDATGTVASNELLFMMELNSTSNGMQESGAQYPQGYPNAQYNSNVPLNVPGVDTTWSQQQPQPNPMGDTGMNTWDGSGSGSQSLTRAHVEAAYGPGLVGNADGYSASQTYSVQANMGNNELQAVLQDPSFWQPDMPQVQSNPATGGQAEWGSIPDPNQHLPFSSSPPGGTSPGLTGMMQDPSLEGQSQQSYFNQYPQQQHQLLVDPQTVPPSPSKNFALPWNGQPGGQLPSDRLHEWQPYAMQGHSHPQQDTILQVLAGQSNQGGLVPPRAMPKRRRSKSDSYNQGHHPGMGSYQNAGPSPSNVYDSPRTQQSQLPLYTMDANNGEDVVLSTGGVGVKMTKSLPTVTPKGGHPHPHHRRVPTIAVADWDVSMSYQQPHLSGPSRSYNGQGNPHNQAVMQGGHPNMNAPSSHPHPPLYQQSRSYPVNDVTLAVAPVSLGRSTSLSKQKQQGQRNEVDEAKLSHAFTSGSFRHDPALQFFLQAIRNSRFYRDDQHEPLLGSPEAEHLLSMVRGRFPHDVRFVPRADAGYERGPIDNDTRESQSIFMLFTENNQCLICGQRKDRTGRALGHVRSDIGHRPYHCHCEKCLQSPNPRRFFSDNLLDDHIKGQMVKQQCQVCHNLFRRGGMKRHMESKHKDAQHYVDEEDP